MDKQDGNRTAQRLRKINGPFVALWVVWILIQLAANGAGGGGRAVFQGLVIWALIAVGVWASEKTGGPRPKVPPSEWGRRD